MDLKMETEQLRQDVDVMSSHFVRMLPEVAAVDRDSTSGCDVSAAKRDIIKKPPRRNRPQSRKDGSCVKHDGLPQEPGVGRRGKTGYNNQEFDDDDKENESSVSRRTSVGVDGSTSQRSVESRSTSPTRSSQQRVYQQCLGSVISSYLSPLRVQPSAKSLRQARRFFDTLTSPGDVTHVAKATYRDHKIEDGDNNNNNNYNSNTSVWLSDSVRSDVETSSGVETATSSQPAARSDGDDVAKQQVRDGSKSVALCDVSRISAVSSTSVPREQLSSLGGGGLAGVDGGPSSAFHSTFNYPLHSTLRGTSVRCPSPLPESPASPVRWGEPEVYLNTEDRHCCPTRQRDLPPAACRRCGDTTPLRRQRAQARLERQRPPIDRRRRLPVEDEKVQLSSISLHATRGSLPDLSDLSTDSELHEWVERRTHRRTRRCGLNPGMFDVDIEAHVRRRRVRPSCTHCRCQSNRPCVRRSADPLTMFDARRKDPVRTADHAWSRTPSSVDGPSCRRHTAAVSVQSSLQRPIGCVPSNRHGNDVAVVMETRRRRHRQGVNMGCGRSQLLSKKLKLFSNILCSARAADVTQLTTLGHV